MSKKSGSSSEIKKELFMIILVDIQMKIDVNQILYPTPANFFKDF